MIGEDISALANAAAYCDRPKAHDLGRGKRHAQNRRYFVSNGYLQKGNQLLEIWLRTQLSDNAEYEFISGEIENKSVVSLIITRAAERTVMFQRTEYIRVGSSTKKLNEVPSMKATLWDHIRSARFEELPVMENLTLSEALHFLDSSTYFDLLKIPMPSAAEAAAYYLMEDRLLIQQDDGQYSITNLGAILLAKRLNSFPAVSRKAIRVVQYRGSNRMEMIREMSGDSGYAVGYESMIRFIEAMLPAAEIIEDGIRRTELAYPSLAIREAVANALIHQNFSLQGTGPLIEIFSN